MVRPKGSIAENPAKKILTIFFKITTPLFIDKNDHEKNNKNIISKINVIKQKMFFKRLFCLKNHLIHKLLYGGSCSKWADT